MDIFFTRLNRKQYLSLILIGLACFYCLSFLSKIQGAWFGLAVVSAMTLVRYEGGSNKPSLYLLLYAAVICFSVFLTGITQKNPLAYLTYLIFIVFIANYLEVRFKLHRYLSFWLIIFVIIGGLQFVTLQQNSYRIEMMFAGYLICALALLDFAQNKQKIESKQSVDVVLRNLRQFSNDIFTCFSVLYADNNYIFERRLHEQKVKYMQSIMMLENQITDNHFINTANKIFEELIDCSQLRWRVSDAATFELCHQEIQSINHILNRSFDILIAINAKDSILPLVSMDQQIESLESIYESVLQIAAKDPFVFLLFIASLKRLQQTLYSLYHKDANYVAA